MDKIKTNVVIDTRMLQLKENISGKEVTKSGRTNIDSKNAWQRKAPELIVGIFKQAQASGTDVDFEKVLIDSPSWNFLKELNKAYKWRFMEMVREVKI